MLHAIDLAMLREFDAAKAVLEPVDDPLADRLFEWISAAERRARREAERQSELRHEIGNALSIVQANLEGIIDGILEPTPARMTGIHDALTTAGGLLDGWREGRFGERERTSVRIDTFNICQIVESQVALVSGMAAAKNVRVIHDRCGTRHDGCTFFRGDSDRIGQILRDVLINAVRLTPPGGAVTLGCDRPDGELILSVAGTAKSQSAVSEPLDAIGGELRTLSNDAAGTTFTLKLPGIALL